MEKDKEIIEPFELEELEPLELEEIPAVAKGADESIPIHDFDPEEELKKSKNKKKKILAIVLPIVSVVLIASVLCGVMFGTNLFNKSEEDDIFVIGYQIGALGEYYALNNLTNNNCVGYHTITEAIQNMVDNNDLDCIIADKNVAKSISNTENRIKIIDISLMCESYAIGVNKNDSTLLNNVNNIIESIKQNGILDAIFNNYSDGNQTHTGISSAVIDMSRQDQQLVVATNAAFSPYEYKEGEKYYGIDMEIAKIIADELMMELVICDMEFASVVTSVGNNGVDLAIAAITINDYRKVYVDFSIPYEEGNSQYLIVKKDCTLFDNCKSAEDVENILRNK